MYGTTTGRDFFYNVNQRVTNMSPPWGKPFGLITDRAPAMSGGKWASWKDGVKDKG